MNKSMFLKSFLLLSSFLFVACINDTYKDIVAVEAETILTLKWNKAYNDDTLEKSIVGLQWTLSYLGASIPISLNGITSENNLIKINIEQIGFNETAKQKILQLHNAIKTSEEYNTTGAIDLGRYVTLLLGSAEHYYEITGVPFELNDLIAQYNLNSERGFVNNSGVSFENRIISFSEQDGLNQLFFCTEVDPITGEIIEYETVDLMPNGQTRFGIYNKNGVRISNSDPTHSFAGKPAKCMWCHESSIQPLFSEQENKDGFLPYLDFKNRLDDFRSTHKNLQSSLADGVDFQQTQQHALAEFLYILFMEPSAERLSLEWGMSVTEVESLLSELPTHTQEEFHRFENLYYRDQVEPFSPFKGLQVSNSVREQSEIEVNYIN